MKRQSSPRKKSTGLRRLLEIWFLQHAQAFIFSLGQMSKNIAGSILTTAVIGVSLSLPAGFYILLNNAKHIASQWEAGTQITLFLKYEIDDTQAENLAARMRDHQDIEQVKLISRNAALEEYREHSGFGAALDVLKENPLPAVLLLQPAKSVASFEQNEQLIAFLDNLPEVDSAQFDRQWARRLFTIIEIFQRGVAILSTLLAVAVLLIIGNTIRLAIYNRYAEIEITKLFGATNGFIQRPFLYSGLIHGVGGSIMAWFLLFISLKLLEQPVMRLSGLYFSDFRLVSLGFKETLLLLGLGGMLGLVGSWFSVQRHLREVEPR